MVDMRLESVLHFRIQFAITLQFLYYIFAVSSRLLPPSITLPPCDVKVELDISSPPWNRRPTVHLSSGSRDVYAILGNLWPELY